MNKFWVSVLLVVSFFSAFAQRGEIVVKSGVNFSLDLADSLMFVLPSYHMGLVVFNDGERSQALLNINNILQGVSFIDTAGDTLFVANENDVAAVYVANRFFKKYGSLYLEVLNPRAEVSVALGRILVLDEPVTEGAYGSKSRTNGVTSVKLFTNESGYTRSLSKDLNVPWRYSFSVFLVKGDRVFMSSKRSFLKVFPSLSSFISEYLEQNKVDFRRLEEVQPLLDLCLERL